MERPYAACELASIFKAAEKHPSCIFMLLGEGKG